jgi:hypothetical protein
MCSYVPYVVAKMPGASWYELKLCFLGSFWPWRKTNSIKSVSSPGSVPKDRVWNNAYAE